MRPTQPDSDRNGAGNRQHGVPPVVAAAWYPDPDDPRLVRYWDGLAWTEHRGPIGQPGPDGASRPLDMASSSSVPEDSLPGGAGGAGEGAAGVDMWVDKAERAVARAASLNTPDAWEDASQAALVVTEIAQTMHAVAEAQRLAEHMDGVAAHAQHEARAATQAAADAVRTAEQARTSAANAGDAARVAAKRAAAAKQDAVRLASSVPAAATSARTAAQEAAVASKAAHKLDQIVARADASNTLEAWSTALRLASDARRGLPTRRPEPLVSLAQEQGEGSADAVP